jgi:hypothetical protein
MNNFLAITRIFIVVFYVFTIFYDVNYVGLKFNPKLEKLGIFMAGRLMFITGCFFGFYRWMVKY